MDRKGRTQVAIEPSRVDCIEEFSQPFDGMGEHFPAATKIIMQGKQEYIVQGDVSTVTEIVNNNLIPR
jgi:hypothetical protein